MIYEAIYKKNTENTEENLMDFIKDLHKFPKNIKNYLKNQGDFNRNYKENFFQEKISENIDLSEKLQVFTAKLPKEPKCEQIIEKFLKSQKILEEIYEDFLLKNHKKPQKKTEDISKEKTEKNPEILKEKNEISIVIQEIKSLKKADSHDIDLSFYCKILKTIENMLISLEIPQKKQLKEVFLLIKEANELSELCVLKGNFEEFNEKLLKKDEIIMGFSKEIQEKNEILKNLEGENVGFQLKINENLMKFERIMKENEKFSSEIDFLREELLKNKVISDENTMKTQKKFNEEKHKELSKKKAKNHEIKEKLRKYEEDFYAKNEENKRLKDFQKANENELKLIKTELNVSIEEKYKNLCDLSSNFSGGF